jgi:hypothetical protein
MYGRVPIAVSRWVSPCSLTVGIAEAFRTMTHECDLRKTEIQDLGPPTLGDKNVGRFDVAVDDAFAMGGIESIGNLDGQTQQDIGRDGFLRDAMLQRLAVERLHHN